MVSGVPEDRRAQLLLIGSLLIAVSILASIVLLNSIHESPEVYSQQDGESLDTTRWTAAEIEDNLERLFLANTSVIERGEALPYAEQDNLSLVVAEFEKQYLNLSTREDPGIVSVDVVGNRTGGIARQNEPITGYEAFPSGPAATKVIEGAATVPRLSLFVNETTATASSPMIVEISDTTATEVTMEISQSGIQGDVTCSLTDFEYISVELEKGVGSVRTDEEYCAIEQFGGSLTPPLDVEIADGGTSFGTFTVTAAAHSSGSLDSDIGGALAYRWFSDDAGTVVNPIFEVTYRNPDVRYNSTFALYNSTQP